MRGVALHIQSAPNGPARMSSVSWQLDSVPRSDWDVHIQDPEVPVVAEVHPVDPVRRMLFMLVLLCVIAALWAAETLIVPILAAAFLSMCLSPVVSQMARATPRVLAAILVMSLLVIAIWIVISILVGPAQEWLSNAPASLKAAGLKLKALSAPLIAANRATESVIGAGTSAATQSPFPSINLWDALHAAPKVVVGVFTVLLLAVFFLVYGDNLLRKLVLLSPTLTHKKRAVGIVRAIQHDTSRYLLLTCLINGALGVATALVLWMLKVPDPLLWGTLAALCNFVPYVGAITMTVILVLVGLFVVAMGVALAVLLCIAVGVLLFVGILSTSVAVGIVRRNPAAGVRVLFIQAGAVAGAVCGTVVAWLVPGKGSEALLAGAVAGLVCGGTLGDLLNRACGRAASRFTAWYEARYGNSPVETPAA